MDNEQHHANPAIGSSGLALLDRSPLHYWAAYLDPNRVPRKSTPAMTFGTAVHAAILEPERFVSGYVVKPADCDARTKAGKEWISTATDAGLIVLDQDDYQSIAKMSIAIHALPMVRAIMRNKPVFETSIMWTSADGVQCKSRPDIYVPPCPDFPLGLVADLKTTRDASARAFANSMWGFAGYIQAALYSESCKGAPFVWLAVESDAPHAAAAYTCPQDMMDYGHSECARLREVYKRCAESGNWHGYEAAQDLQLQGWMLKAMQDDEIAVEVAYV